MILVVGGSQRVLLVVFQDMGIALVSLLLVVRLSLMRPIEVTHS